MISEIKILSETKDLLVVFKPALVHSVNLPNQTSNSVADFLKHNYPSLKNISEKNEDFGILNRLDFETQGIILVAKNPQVYAEIKEIAKHGGFIKYYYAITEGDVFAPQDLKLYLGQSSRRSKNVRVFKEKPRTKYRAIPRQTKIIKNKYLAEKNASLTEVSINQGARHQIRAQLSFINHPLLGDDLYKSEKTSIIKDTVFFLYAYKIELPKLKFKFEIKLPSEVTKIFKL